MGMLDAATQRVAAGATVELRPSGSSMVPLIRSRQRVIVVPVDPAKVEVGDIVLARVAGAVYLHLVVAPVNSSGVAVHDVSHRPTDEGGKGQRKPDV
jgi:hypothetical protein